MRPQQPLHVGPVTTENEEYPHAPFRTKPYTPGVQLEPTVLVPPYGELNRCSDLFDIAHIKVGTSPWQVMRDATCVETAAGRQVRRTLTTVPTPFRYHTSPQVVLKMTQQARRKKGVLWFEDYRGASVFSAKTNARGGGAVSGPAAATAIGPDVGDNASGNGGLPGGGNDAEDFFVGWRKRLAVLAEAQRGTLLQLSGVHVTSAAARAAFKVERDARLQAEASAERADRERGRGARIGGSGGGTRSKRYGDGRRGASGGGGGCGGGVRLGRSDRARRGSGGVDSRGKGETEDEVAERNLRAFDRMEYI